MLPELIEELLLRDELFFPLGVVDGGRLVDLRRVDGEARFTPLSPRACLMTYRLALELPGVVVLHEFMLHHLVRGLTLARGDAAGYLDEMRYAAGRSGEMAARRLLDLFS